MKIACLQFAPDIGQVTKNQEKAARFLESSKPGDFDLLVLPELCFSGYVFKTKEDIESFLEHSETGPSILWAKQHAFRLKCYIQLGFPRFDSTTQAARNSICLISPTGNLITLYDKHFLFNVDERWAVPGESFKALDIQIEPAEILKVGFGICMDLNPHQFKAPFEAYEFANFHKEQQVDLICGSMAWVLRMDDDNDDESKVEEPEDEQVEEGEPQWETIRYWVMRLMPLLEATSEKDGKDVIVVICNRTGGEN
ncbi:Carbon-nitrogen hydrolase, partial [Chytridiales sp. JEL 0842]